MFGCVLEKTTFGRGPKKFVRRVGGRFREGRRGREETNLKAVIAEGQLEAIPMSHAFSKTRTHLVWLAGCLSLELEALREELMRRQRLTGHDLCVVGPSTS